MELMDQQWLIICASGLIEGNVHQLLIRLLAVAITAGYAFIVTFVLLKTINVFVPVRVSPDQELAGLDNTIHKETAYNLVD